MSREQKPVRLLSTVVRKIRPSRYAISTPSAGPGVCAGSPLPPLTQLDMFGIQPGAVDIWPYSSRLRTGVTGSGRASNSQTTSVKSATEQQRKALISAISGSSS